MRIRQVKPEFFGDADMAALPFRTRLTYIGLWSEADDAGWLTVDAVQIAHDLYGFDSRGRREAWVVDDLVRLQEGGHLEVYDCGHGCIPTLPKHQRFGGRLVHTVHDAHARGCSRTVADVRPGIGKVEVREGTVSQGRVEARDQDRNGATPFRERMAAAGVKV